MRPLVLCAASLIAVLPCVAPSFAEPAAGAAAPVPAADALLLEQVPADAQVCVAWNFLEHPAYAGSRFEKFNQLSQRQPITAESVGAHLDATFAHALKDAPVEAKAFAGVLSKTLAVASVHGGAFYVRHFEVHPKNGPVPPTVVLLVRAQKEGAALMEDWKKLLAENGALPVAADFRNGVLRLSANLAGTAETWTGPAGSLAKNPRFLASTRGLGDNQAMLAYVDAANLVLRLKAHAEWEKATKGRSEVDFEKLDAALGLSGLQTLAFAGGFTKDGQWHWDGLVEAPAPRSGALAMLDGSTVSQALLKRVPASADGFTAVGFDLGATIDAVLALVAKEEPKARPQYDKALADLKAQMGIDLKATLAGLGSQWLAFSDPMSAGGGILGTVVVSPLRDGQAVDANLGKATTLGNAVLRQQMASAHNPFVMGFLADTFRGVTIHRLGIPLLSPGYAVQDNTLFLGLMPQAIQGAVRPVKEPLVDSTAYRNLFAQVVPANAKLRVVGYADLARMAPHTYGTGLMLHQWGMGASVMFTGHLAPAQLPVLSDLLPILGPDLSAAWMDAQGLHFRSKGPFPGATLTAGGIDGLPVIATAGVAAGVLVPVLATARKNANAMVESVNASSVVKGGEIYSDGNKSFYPGWTNTGKRAAGNFSGLTYMLQEDCAAPKQLTSANQDAPDCPITAGFKKNQAEDMKTVDAWVRAHSCVIYIPDIRRTYRRPGTTDDISANKSTMDEQRIVAFIDPAKAINPEKIGTVRGDTSTGIEAKALLDEMLKAQYGATSEELVAEFRAAKLAPGAVMAQPKP